MEVGILEVPKTKIEKRAIGALENIIDAHNTMDSSFNSMDKEMSWDGYIWIFNSNEKQDKEHYDDKVPVQIKGHIDKDKKFINKKRITYPVDILDLKVYQKDRGVLYFQIFMSEDGVRREVFYSSLFPSKIKSYLEMVRKKENKSSISIAFTKMKQTPGDFYSIIKQFSNESRNQGFGEGPNIKNMIMLKDIKKVTSITASAVGVSNHYEFLQKFAAGEISLYGTIAGCPIELPIEWCEDSILSLNEKIKEKIKVNETIYYNEYVRQLVSDDTVILSFSENLKMIVNTGKFTIEPRSNIHQLRKDADFIFDIIKNDGFHVGEHYIGIKNFDIPEQLEDNLNYYIQLDDTLRMIEFDFDKPMSSLSAHTKKQLVNIVAIKNGLKNEYLSENIHIYNWKLEEKYIPIIIKRHEKDRNNDLINTIYTQKHHIYDTDGNGNYFKVPSFVIVDSHVLSNLYYYDYSSLKAQIDGEEVNEYTINSLNHAILLLINAYDARQDKQLLDLAEYQLNKIRTLEGKKNYFILNELQIKYRKGEFREEEKNILLEMQAEDNTISFGKNVLLERKKEAIKFFNLLSEEEKESIREYPIRYLYESL